jgi:hypothetical protein
MSQALFHVNARIIELSLFVFLFADYFAYNNLKTKQECWIPLLLYIDVLKKTDFFFVYFWFLRHIDTVKVISRRNSFTGGGIPQVPFRAIFQA